MWNNDCIFVQLYNYDSLFNGITMNTYKILSFFICLGIALASCKIYEPVSIQLLKPAQARISPNVYKVILINHSSYQKSSVVINGTNSSSADNTDSIRTNQYFSGLLDVLKNSPRYALVKKDVVFIEKPDYNSQYKSLEWSVIQSLCNENKADAAVVLENYQVSYYYPIKIKQLQWGFYGSLEMQNGSLWKIYSVNPKQVTNDLLLKDTLFWDGSGEYESQVLATIPPLNDAIMQSCYYAGVKYGEHIAQSWQTQNRYLITCENNDFITAISYAKQNKWTEAVEIWKKYPYGKNIRLASFAAYNIAIASEALDHIDIALEWAAKSYLLQQSEYTESYISTLENRKIQNLIIENQLK